MKQVVLHRKRHAAGKTASTIKVGDLVLLRNRRQAGRKGNKLDRRYLGPYMVETISTKGQVFIFFISHKILFSTYKGDP